MAVSKSLRFQILRRDNHACRYCGTAASPERALTVDHVVPVALGGSDDPSNLVAACRDCNAGKSATPADAATVADADQDQMRWADALSRVAEIEARKLEAEDEPFQEFWEFWAARNNQWAYPPTGWEESAKTFVSGGLTWAELKRFAEIASVAYGVTQRNRWRYFCGICWRQVEQRQEAARALLSAEDGQR